VNEKDFVAALIRQLYRMHKDAVVIRPNDHYTLGIPDILCWARGSSLAIEAKQLHPLMPDASRRGRRTGLMLKHEFMGPQISLLRQMCKVGVEAFGLVRVSEDTAFRIHPEDLPKTGNFTYDEMVKIGQPVQRAGGLWEFWKVEHAPVLSAGHRDDPRDGGDGQLDGGVPADLGAPRDHDRDAGAGREPAPGQGRVRQRRVRRTGD
jgi:hypothetical protein